MSDSFKQRGINAGSSNPMYGKSGENSPTFGRKHTPEECSKISVKTKTRMIGKHRGVENPMYGRRGELAPTWKGGVSFEPYCVKFNREFKERVRAFFKYKCMMPGCGHVWQPGERRLSVHHVNYNKMVCCNDVKPLFVPVCPNGCHNKTNHNRDHWERVFTDIITRDYNGQCYIPKQNNAI